MDLYRLNYSREGIENSINPMRSDYSKKLIELSINPMKSEYQENFEKRGWEFIKNVEAVNDIDYTENIEKFRLFKEDCRRKFCPGRKIRLARSQDKYGRRIPPEKKIVAIYAKDRD